MIKLVAFDWNGTIISDVTACVDADRNVFKFYGKKPVTLSRFRKTYDVPFVEYYIVNGFDRKFFLKNVKQIAEIFHTNYEKRAAKIRTRSGTRAVLQYLINCKIDAILFSNHTQQGIQSQLRRLNLKHHFAEVLARSDLVGAVERRDKKYRLLEYIRHKHYGKKEVLIVGDTIEEIEIGNDLGIATVAVTGGFQVTNRLKKAGPKFLIHNMVELINVIKLLNSKR